MVRIGDRVHVKDAGYGRVTSLNPREAASPVLVLLDSGTQIPAFESSLTVLRPPDLGPIGRYAAADAKEQLESIIREAIRDHAAYALDNEEEADLVDMIATAIIAAGWPRVG